MGTFSSRPFVGNFLIKNVSSSSKTPLLNVLDEDFVATDWLLFDVIVWAVTAASADANEGPAILLIWGAWVIGGGETTLETESARSFTGAGLTTTVGTTEGLLEGGNAAGGDFRPGGWLELGRLIGFVDDGWMSTDFFLETNNKLRIKFF